MNIWTYVYAAATLIYGVTFFYVLAKNPYSLYNWVLSFVFASLAVWTAGDAFNSNAIISLSTSEFVMKIQSIGWVFYIFYLFLFILMFTKNRSVVGSPALYIAGYLLSFVFLLSAFSGRMIIYGNRSEFGFSGRWAGTPDTYLFFAYYMALFVIVIILLVRFRSGYVKKSAYREITDIMLTALVLCVVVGTFTNVVFKFMGIYSPFKIELIMLTFAYAIVYAAEKYDILEITPAKTADDLLESIDFGVVLLTVDGIIAAENEKAAAMKAPPGGAEGMKLSGVMDIPALEETMRTGNASACEIKTTAVDGRKLTLHASCVPALKDKKRVGYICVLNDITGRKRAESKLAGTVDELRRSNTDLENFAHIVAHDLREPSRIVSLYLQRFRAKMKGRLSDEMGSCLETALEGALKMNNIIRGIFEYARAERNEKPAMVGLLDVLKEAVATLDIKINESKAIVELPEGETAVLTGDATMLCQLFVNLIDNAIKYGGGSRPEIAISAHKEGGFVVVSVEDNGMGIEPRYREKIFEMFARLHPRGEYPGEGIGLAMCRKIAESHGGSIRAEGREAGAGSVFKVSLPMAADPGIRP
jgi:signal transduction histidine kinase